MNIVFSTAFFLFFISCVSKEPTDQKKYSVVLPRYLQDTVIVTYKLDSLYKEVNPGIELWAAQDAKKYKKDHEIILDFYDQDHKYEESSLKIGAEKRLVKVNSRDDPYSMIDEYPTNFNKQVGYFTKYIKKSDNKFVLSYCTVNKETETALFISMLGNNLSSEDKAVFKSLIGSFTFQKN